MKKFLMGNEAMALGALRAGVGLVAGYPGTPSTEVLQAVAKNNPGDVYVEWSVNEKVALEIAAGASYAGQRTLVTMKQVGLNVASDPLMSLAYVGVEGGMVVLVADDPGPISSQTEQDTRSFAQFSKLPVFDPSSPQEAYLMMEDAFAFSERYKTPVLFRPTTRVCHSYASVDILEDIPKGEPGGFVKDSKWVIFPRLSFAAHKRIEERNEQLRSTLSDCRWNTISGSGNLGIACAGVSYDYMREALHTLGVSCKLMKVSIAHPFPEKLALEFMAGLDKVLVFEELDPVIEKELLYIAAKHSLSVDIKGKLDKSTACAGENSVESALEAARAFFGIAAIEKEPGPQPPELPVRPPVLCAGCPHRASFYAVKQAMKGKKSVFAGDIGCYTLGNAAPLDMVDTCLCMGAGITVAQGIKRVQPDTVCFSFTGDSTFFHTGVAGIINAVYNDADMVAVILDNSTTAMTGHQPNPGTGFNAMGEVAHKISIEALLSAIGVENVFVVDPFDFDKAVAAVGRAAQLRGVRSVIFRSPCIAVSKPSASLRVDAEKCTGCKRCVRELGCPAIVKNDDKVSIDKNLCFGCALCEKVCPFGAIGGGVDG